MEHRWGQRREVDVTVRVGPDSRSLHIARLTSLSVSGAFLWTALPLGSLHTVYIAAVNDDRLSGLLEGRVVRSTDQGIGIEWTELAPQPVVRMMRSFAPLERAPSDELDEQPIRSSADRLA